MEVEKKDALPLDPVRSNELEQRRLWVGNLDLRINEYHFVKIVQKPGNIENFDFLFHRFGPQAGQPRGYAFVTYKTANDAERAISVLNNSKVGSKNIVVRYAHTINMAELDRPKPKLEIPVLVGAKKNENKKISRETAIHAIEAKLKMMNESEEEFQLNKPITNGPAVYQYQKAENSKQSSRYPSRSHHHSKKPYHRTRSRR